MPDDEFHVYDTTLRDGAQQEGLTLTVADKLAIARRLDEFGVGFIEGGWPGAIPKDTEFFRRARTELDLRHAQLAAFGATRRPGVQAADDPQVAALRESGAPVVTLVAKSHDRHVRLALRTTLEENLAMIRDTVSHLRAEGQRVFLDAEHFFDGYRSDPAYALEVVRTAAEAGRGRGRAVRHQRRHAARRAGRRGQRGGRRPPARGSASTATTTPPARWPTAWSRWRPGSATCRAAPTATASGPATPTCSAWSPGCS